MTNNNNQYKWKHFHEKDIYCLCNEFKNIRQENTFFIFSCCYFMYYVFRWIEKWVVLKSNYFLKHKKKKFMMCLCFLSINKNYKNHTFFNLISKVQFQEKWVKTWALIDSEYESMNIINTKYVQKQCLQI